MLYSTHGEAWQQELPFITPESVAHVVARDGASWRSRITDGQPRLGFTSTLHIEQTGQRLRDATDAPTVKRRERFAATVNTLLNERWLSHYKDEDDAMRRTLQPGMGFPIPLYLPWEKLPAYGILPADARQELWQRDLGDAIPAFALAAHLWPDMADTARERMKAFVLSTLDFRTWGDGVGVANMDLALDHIARGIAIAFDWHQGAWTQAETDRIFSVLRDRLGTLLQGAFGQAYWARGYTDNHCHCALATLGICGAAFLDRIPEAQEWLGAAIVGFDLVAKYCNSDGSSAEGIPYWSYGMSFMCQFAELTDHLCGTRALYDAPYFANAVQYRLHCALPNLSGTVPFGDAPKRDYYGPSHVLYSLGKYHRDTTAQWLADSIPFQVAGGPDVAAWSLLWRDDTLAPVTPTDLPRDVHLRDWDVALSRSGWTENDYLLAVKSGYTNRNHSHLDAGTILLGFSDEWLIEAPGYGKVGDGFWDVTGPRWTFYSNATESHSTLLINGQNQLFDKQARATIDGFESSEDLCWISINLSGAYAPDRTIRRQVLHRRNRYILVLDEVAASDSDQPNLVEWLLQPGRSTKVNAHGAQANIIAAGATIVVRSLAPDQIFRTRQPRSKHVDIPEDAIRTLALSANGSALAFATLIVVENEANSAHPSAAIEKWAIGDRTVRIDGNGFSDRLTSRGLSL